MDELRRIFLSVLFTPPVFLCCGCTMLMPMQLSNISSNHRQVLIVRPIHDKSYFGVLSAWENDNGHWKKVYAARAVLGRNGLAALNTKQEGDGQTPAGVYPITTAFGYDPDLRTRLNYRQATREDFWVDDVASSQYNQWVHGTPNAQSFERMKRADNLYRLGAVIEYNTHPVVPGRGSAIFLHVWRAYYKPTAGCVALSERYIRKILNWLDKDKNPVIVLGGTPEIF